MDTPYTFSFHYRCYVYFLLLTTCYNDSIRTNVPLTSGSQNSITERRVSELIPVLGSQPAGDVSHKPGVKLPLLSARPAVTLATLKRAATNFYRAMLCIRGTSHGPVSVCPSVCQSQVGVHTKTAWRSG